jgi:hypothetical protein
LLGHLVGSLQVVLFLILRQVHLEESLSSWDDKIQLIVFAAVNCLHLQLALDHHVSFAVLTW